MNFFTEARKARKIITRRKTDDSLMFVVDYRAAK